MLEDITIDAIDQSVWHVAQPCGSLGNSIHYRLNIRRRAGNDFEDLARRSLLLQRFGEFLKQPDVLDGDDRLVGEGFEQRYLLVGEGAHLSATDKDDANGDTLTQ